MTMNITPEQLQQILEAALMVAGRPLPVAHMQRLFDEAEQPSTAEIQTALEALRERYQISGIELREVASGFQFQAKTELSPWLSRLWEERPPRYSRALLETLALIAYRQPITRAEIEEIRGVTVSSHITKTLLEREWIRVIGYREVVGKPALYGTTKTFLDHFNLKSLDELPTLAELKDLDVQEAKLQVQLELPQTDETEQASETTKENESASEMVGDENEERLAQATAHEDRDESESSATELDETEFHTNEADAEFSAQTAEHEHTDIEESSPSESQHETASSESESTDEEIESTNENMEGISKASTESH